MDDSSTDGRIHIDPAAPFRNRADSSTDDGRRIYIDTAVQPAHHSSTVQPAQQTGLTARQKMVVYTWIQLYNQHITAVRISTTNTANRADSSAADGRIYMEG